MASLRRSGRYWHVRFRDAKRTPPEVVVSLYAADYTEAQAKRHLRDLEADLRAGRFDPWGASCPAPASLTVGEAAQSFIQAKCAAGRRSERGGWGVRSARERSYVLMAFARHVGEQLPVSSLTSEHVAAYVYSGRVAAATQDGRRRVVSSLLTWMRLDGYAATVQVPAPRAAVRRLPTFLSETEMEAVCAEIVALSGQSQARKHAPKEGPSRVWMAGAVRFAFYEGVRLGELVALRVASVDLVGATLRVGDETFQTKTRRENVIPLVPQALAVVRPLCEGRPAAELLFSHAGAQRLSKTFREAARVAIPGKMGAHFHSLRHSCAVYWRSQGVALEDIRDLLRHTSIRTTEIYDQIVVTDLGGRFRRAAPPSSTVEGK